MKVSRKASIPAAVAVTLGLAATGVSCTGSKADKTDAGKTTGTTLAKGDKTTAKPGTPATPAGKTPAAPPAAPAAGSKPTAGAPAAPAAGSKPAPGAAPPSRPPATPPATPPRPAAVAMNDDAPLPPPKPGAPLPPPKPATPPGGAKPPVAPPPIPPATPPATPPAPPPTTAKPPVPPKPPATPPATPPAPPPTTAKPPAPATPPATPPVTAKPPAPVPPPESEADKILRQRIQALQLEREKNQLMVATFLDHARDAAERAEWEDAAEWSSKALDVDHNNAEAEALLRRARAAQGWRDASIATVTDIMVQSVRVKREQALFSVRQHFETAMRAKKAGEYSLALQHLELATTAMAVDPAGIEWGDLEKKVSGEMAEVKRLHAQAEDQSKLDAARQAYLAVKKEEAKLRLAEADKRNALFRTAMDDFEAGRFDKAANTLEEYLSANPADRNARSLHLVAVRASHEQASEETLRTTREQFARWRLDMQETTTPYHRILTWPSQEHWNTITQKRKDLGTISEPVADSPETASTKARLRTDRVTFSFQGQPFKDVVSFISTAKGLNIFIDGEVAAELDAVPITLTLNDATVEDALKTLNKFAGMVYVVDGSIVRITKPENARGQPVIKVHAVGDLTVQLTNFIAGNLLLLPANAEESDTNPRFDQGTEGVPAFGGIDELIDLVKKNVSTEEYWSSEGVSINGSGADKMLIVAEPDVQAQAAQFLNDLRAFSGIVVTIETRFLSVTDNFLRDVGVDIRGLGNGSPGPLALLDDVTSGLDDQASAGFDNNGPGLPAAGSNRPASGAFFNNNSDGDYRGRWENVFDRALGSKISNSGGMAVQWTLVDDTSLSLILRAVEKTQEGRLLQAPSVTVFNTQRANITLINQLTYIQDFDVEVAQTAFIADPIIGIIQDGLVLDVQPTVSHDRKYITLTLRPTIANLVRPIPTFTTSLGAFTTPVTIQIPELKVQKAQTTVRVPDGGTFLMGGLKTINMADLKSTTPWFSSIPFASFFFGRQGTVKEMDNLMVIVKATISDLQEEERRLRR